MRVLLAGVLIFGPLVALAVCFMRREGVSYKDAAMIIGGVLGTTALLVGWVAAVVWMVGLE